MLLALQGMLDADVHLVGAFSDSKGEGEVLLETILACLQASTQHFNLVLACVGSANTTAEGSPRCTSLSLDTSTGTAYPGKVSVRSH